MVEFYISQTEAANHAVREAACACIAELGTKVRVHKSPVFTVVVLNGDMYVCIYCVVCGRRVRVLCLQCMLYIVALNRTCVCMRAVYSECRVLFIVHEECTDAAWAMMCLIPFND